MINHPKLIIENIETCASASLGTNDRRRLMLHYAERVIADTTYANPRSVSKL